MASLRVYLLVMMIIIGLKEDDMLLAKRLTSRRRETETDKKNHHHHHQISSTTPQANANPTETLLSTLVQTEKQSDAITSSLHTHTTATSDAANILKASDGSLTITSAELIESTEYFKHTHTHSHDFEETTTASLATFEEIKNKANNLTEEETVYFTKMPELIQRSETTPKVTEAIATSTVSEFSTSKKSKEPKTTAAIDESGSVSKKYESSHSSAGSFTITTTIVSQVETASNKTVKGGLPISAGLRLVNQQNIICICITLFVSIRKIIFN